MKHKPQTHVLICGDRDWDETYIMSLFIFGLRSYEGLDIHLYHGAAPGADSMAAQVARETNGFIEHPFLADWQNEGKSAGPRRNQRMLDAMLADTKGDDICFAIAFKNHLTPDLARGGTENMIKLCQKSGIIVYHVEEL